jgi:energy-coupling factor transporter transmembrane protein EcfT
MVAGSSPYAIIKALRSWKLPEIIIIVVSFTIQFLRQLTVDFKILQNNLLRRNINFSKMNLFSRLSMGSQMIIPIIGRLVSDLKYKVIAMELNGYARKSNLNKH